MEEKNIYKCARQKSGLTQLKAAELLSISVETIKTYENNKRNPSDEIILMMAKVYKNEYLIYQHFKQKSAASVLLPEISERNLSSATLTLHRQMKKYIDHEEKLFDISSNDKVDEDEVKDFSEILGSLDEIVGAIMSLKFCSNKTEV
ncbi:MAG: helix-turn-helix transcriptional regulator [Clostridium sp.]|uniref:helix-turn-helix transcriptional regulator n=1 Tax=Clostridium TaxID=1485 RepID=UPI0008A51A08|nr:MULTISPECIES: helix-turn-helix transcriptional regulator [Clostridium]APF22602.1 helix-turn-helix family protein [Clostridium butyricum]MDU0323814.1 helix-turn-helix transcriptional regulator [Clostridium butyricum]MDU3087994.1 helix-turn-helix transcriptional regulator [Clostridium sp.]MDU6040311.1 helix-turn-helix transcriptional regulator [Clostridium butyricum]OFS21017.1 transcriptional regulator [Clostridium sp. HMSC19A10]